MTLWVCISIFSANTPTDREGLQMSPKAYFDPPEDVLDGRVGRKLQMVAGNPRPFESYFAQLYDGEVMYVGLTGVFVLRPVVAYAHSKDWYEVFYQKYRSGAYENFDVYALPAAVAEEEGS